MKRATEKNRWRLSLFAGLCILAALWFGQKVSYSRDSTEKQSIDRIVIYKGKHLMEAYSNDRLVKTYTVSIGRGGHGPKQVEGDQKTPEGIYRIDSRHVSETFHRFLHISYPNSEDRARFDRLKKEKRFPHFARIGGDVGIHGQRKGLGWLPHKWLDWTLGCVAVDNDEIEELYVTVKHGARCEIYP